jgi:Putative F0F1-ATPase subunit Ca2+/Mg2+ transporter
MKALLPVVGAGGIFAGAALAGLLLGIWLGRQLGQPLWVFAGLLGGLAIGGYSAFRLLLRSM